MFVYMYIQLYFYFFIVTIGAGDAKLITDKSKMHSDIPQQHATTSAESEV